MNLQELFQSHLEQEFPPKVVFAYYRGDVKSIPVTKLHEYNLQYEVTGHYEKTSVYSTDTTKLYQLPVLALK